MKFINEAPWDRLCALFSLGLLAMAWAAVTGGWAVVVLVVGAVALLTGWWACPLCAAEVRTNKA
jgi:hypothetical protein